VCSRPGSADVGRLLQDPSIIRNRGKIQATVENARAMRSARPSLAALAQSYASTRKRAPRSLADLPTTTSQAEKFAKQLRSQGYNDHIHGCFRATDYTQPQTI
jgi:DNA-3-methyladenine glycosylase I